MEWARCHHHARSDFWKIEQKRNLKSHLQALTLLAMKPENPKSILCTNPSQTPPKVTCTLLQLVMHPCDCYIWWFQVTCYICGRDFGSRSIGIHLPSCTKKWEQVKISWVSQNIAPLLSWSLGMLVDLTWSGSGAREASQEGAETFAHCSG